MKIRSSVHQRELAWFDRLDCEVDGSKGWYVGVFYSKCVLDFDRFDKHAAVSQDHFALMESHSVVSRTKRERGDLARCSCFYLSSNLNDNSSGKLCRSLYNISSQSVEDIATGKDENWKIGIFEIFKVEYLRNS